MFHVGFLTSSDFVGWKSGFSFSVCRWHSALSTFERNLFPHDVPPFVYLGDSGKAGRTWNRRRFRLTVNICESVNLITSVNLCDPTSNEFINLSRDSQSLHSIGSVLWSNANLLLPLTRRAIPSRLFVFPRPVSSFYENWKSFECKRTLFMC